MIQQKDLRVGNWVLLDDKLFEVDVIVTFADNDFDPIPLTPEILEKAGFVFKKGDLGNDWYFKNIKHIVFDADQSTGFKKVFVSCGAYGICEINHLHQLQNLYFALTGEELNVQL